jgi:hypothetical protein
VVAPTNVVDYSVQLEDPDLRASTPELNEDISQSSESSEDAVSVSLAMEGGGCEDTQPTKVEGKSRLIWRDEWDCDFCGPDCFCWIVDVASSR